MTSIEEIEACLQQREAEGLEFKEAKQQFDLDRLVDYCVAIANERGGKIVLGVTDKLPRRIVGTNAFPAIGATKQRLLEKLNMRVEIDEVHHTDGRVLMIRVPSRPIGTPLHHAGRYLMRSGESLVSMTHDQIRAILAEAETDFSVSTCIGASADDLDSEAVDAFRNAWIRKSGNERLRELETDRLLSDAGLMVDGRVTHAAIFLLGSTATLTRHVPQAEIVFEWRDRAERIEFQDRREFRRPLLLALDDIWQTINLRNTHEHFQDGLFVRDIATFNEAAIREAVLNAVAHRDYRASGSVFVRQSPSAIQIESPGGFPPGVTAENILFRQVPRNRLLSETLARIGLVERSGQGVDRMFETSIREGKAPPDFSGSDAYHVSVILSGAITDRTFLRFLEKVSLEGTYSISTSDLIVLDLVNRGREVPEVLRARASRLGDEGVLERVGRGRGTRYVLSPRFYELAGMPAEYTRRRGLDRETNKELLARHIHQNAPRGVPFEELAQVLPSLSRDQIKTLLKELKGEGRIRTVGARRAAVWVPAT